MKVLLTGASGFIGGRILKALVNDGHRVVALSRRKPASAAPQVQHLSKNFAEMLTPADWDGSVQGIDVVINAVGILRESGLQRFDTLHHRAPAALFQAASAAGVRAVIQVSALGADDEAATAYHRSKKAADDVLLGLPVSGVVLQPSVVIGLGGASTAMFTMQAKLPAIPLPGKGQQVVQPVHVDDLVDGVMTLVSNQQTLDRFSGRRVAIVGPEAMTMRQFYSRLRSALGIASPARFISIPMWYMGLVAQAGKWIPNSPLDPDTLSMLERGSAADPADIQALLGRAPRPVEAFFSSSASENPR